MLLRLINRRFIIIYYHYKIINGPCTYEQFVNVPKKEVMDVWHYAPI